MHVPEDAAAAFSAYADANTAYWRARPSPPSDGWIIVDLYHNNPEYLRLNLLLAKYLQQREGGRLLGLTMKTPRPGIVDPEPEPLAQLAKSFGVEELLTFDMTSQEPGVEDGVMFDALGAQSAEKARATLLAWKRNGVPIGRYAYEHYLRLQKTATLDPQDSELRYAMTEARALQDWYIDIFRSHPPRRVVVGHVVYNFWGNLGHLALHRRVPVVYAHPFSPALVYLLSDDPGDAPAQMLTRPADTKVFNEVVWPARAKLAETVATLARDSDAGLRLPKWWVGPTMGGADASALRSAVKERLGWRDQAKPVILICGHTFADAALSDVNAFEDHHVWIEKTMRIAAADPTRYWLFKRHPHEHIYGQPGAPSAYGAPPYPLHIHVADTELAREEMFAVADYAITVRGSLGYDLPAHGIPCLLAGHGPYSELGFNTVVETASAYGAALADIERVLAKPTAEQIERAQTYLALNQIFAALAGPHYSGIDVRNGWHAHWVELKRALDLFGVEQDPLYRNLIESVARGFPRALDCEVLRFLGALQPM